MNHPVKEAQGQQILVLLVLYYTFILGKFKGDAKMLVMYVMYAVIYEKNRTIEILREVENASKHVIVQN